MPVQPPNIPQGGFGGGAQQLLAQMQRESGTKGNGILDSLIGQAFGMLMQKFLNKEPEEDDEGEGDATAGFWRAWNRSSPGSGVGGGPVGGGSFGGTLGFGR